MRILALVILGFGLHQTTLAQKYNDLKKNKIGVQIAANGLIFPEFQRTVYPKVNVVGIVGVQDLSFLGTRYTNDEYAEYSNGGYIGTGLVYHFYTFGKKKKKKHKKTSFTAYGGLKIIGGKAEAIVRDYIYGSELGSYFSQKDFGQVSFYRNEWTFGIEMNIKNKLDLQFTPLCFQNGKTWKDKTLDVRTHPLHSEWLPINMQIGIHYKW
ncbi:MAG: hypothetical protein ACPGYY_02715 [Bacteroidia bacterium]